MAKPKKKLTENFSIRLTPRDLKIFEELAHIMDRNVSDTLRALLHKEYERVVKNGNEN